MHFFQVVSTFLALAGPGAAANSPDGPPYETVNVNVSTPRNNAPLDEGLAHYKLNGTNGKSDTLTHSFIRVSCGAVMSVHHTDPDVFSDAGTKQRPILLLNHGYPQSSYIWRRITKDISKRVPVVVPDRPGYGLSSSCLTGTDERTTAGALIDTVTAVFGKGKTVVLAGHDRGARAVHRAAVDLGQGMFPDIDATGAFMADIVPIVAEYDSFTNPNNSVGYFHWSFLPRAQSDFSRNVIMAYGGGNFVDFILHAGSGVNESAKASFVADNALETYHTFYDQLSVTNASVWDYYSGATTDYLDMVADQKAGRKIKMPTHIMYSHYNLVAMSGFDVKGIWSNYVERSAGLTTEGVCCGQGHFIIELAPQETIDQLNKFLDRLNVKSEVLKHEREL